MRLRSILIASSVLLIAAADRPRGDSDAVLELARRELAAGNTAAAEKWLDNAVERDDPQFESDAGHVLADGQDYPGAIRWLEKAMLAGDRDAAASVAEWYETSDPPRAVEALKRLGDDDWLARLEYAGGRHLPPDHALAANSFRHAAEQGDPAAAYTLAKMLEAGDGVAPDARAAGVWMQRAAQAGDRDAMLDMILRGQERSLPRNVVDSAAFREVHIYAKKGMPFHVVSEPGWAVEGSFDGVVRFYLDRVEIAIERAVLHSNGDQEVPTFKVQLARNRKGGLWHWSSEGSGICEVGAQLKKDQPYAVAKPMTVTIERDTLTRLDQRWLSFGIETRIPGQSTSGWCYAHAKQYLLSTQPHE